MRANTLYCKNGKEVAVKCDVTPFKSVHQSAVEETICKLRSTR